MDVWVDGCMYEWTDVWMVGWLHERVGCCQSRVQTSSAGFEKCGSWWLGVAPGGFPAACGEFSRACKGHALKPSRRRPRALGSFGLRCKGSELLNNGAWKPFGLPDDGKRYLDVLESSRQRRINQNSVLEWLQETPDRPKFWS